MTDQVTRSPEVGRDDEVRERPRENRENYDEPWAKLRLEEEGSLLSRYETAPTLSAETLGLGEQLMIQKADRETIDFARNWFDGNRDTLENRGYAIPDNPDDAYIIRIVKEAGGFEELKTNDRYAEDNRRIENAYALRADLAKGASSIESQTILMRELGREQEAKEDRLKEYDQLIYQEGKKNPQDKAKIKQLSAERTALEAETKQLDKSIREVYVCLNGKTPEEVVQGPHKQMAKGDYVATEITNLKEVIKDDDNNLEGWTRSANRLGYQIIKNERRIGSEYIITDRSGVVVRKFGVGSGNITKLGIGGPLNSIDKFLHETEISRATRTNEAIWEARNEEIKTEAKAELRVWEGAADRAVGGVEAVYDRVRERLITEHIQETRKRDPKSKEQLVAIERDFKGKGLNATEFIGAVVARGGDLANLSGRWESDQAVVKEFAESWGVPVGSREWEDFVKKQKGVYERRVKTRRGFIDWMIDMVLITSDKKKDNTGRKQPGGGAQNRVATGGTRAAGTTVSGGNQGQPANRRPGSRRVVTRRTPPPATATPTA